MDLLFYLNQAAFALGNEMAARLAKLGITPRHYCVLHNALEEDLTQIRLAERSMLDKTTMVVTLDELQRAGLTERRPSPNDRRARIVAVTQKGRRVADEAQAIVEEMQREILDALPEEERIAFSAALERLVAGPLGSPSHVDRTLRRPRERSLISH